MKSQSWPGARLYILLFILGLALFGVFARLVYLQIFNQEFLKNQSKARAVRIVNMPATRGMITDRNGEILAVSIPVQSAWAVPYELSGISPEKLNQLAALLNTTSQHIRHLVDNYRGREFIFLKRKVTPMLAHKIEELAAPGVYLQPEYQRFYPTGEVSVHLIGFTDIDERGQEGLERAFDEWLTGVVGSKQVIRDRRGQIVDDALHIKAPRPGKALVLSLDRRIQYIAYAALKRAVKQYQAKGGSVVVVNPENGEILALVNQPSINPNDRSHFSASLYRNRAITDVFEPGSVMKPFATTALLESGLYTPRSIVNTAPGHYQLGDQMIHDVRNYGKLTLAEVLIKSSNVGISKMALTLPSHFLNKIYRKFGFGFSTNSGFPGESDGRLTDSSDPIKVASLAFGYGLSVTTLQLAQAYSILALRGVKRPIGFFKKEKPKSKERVINAAVSEKVLNMMAQVTVRYGTGRRAKVKGYSVAGKTGTSRKIKRGHYSKAHYYASFAGIVPEQDPQLVIVVMVDDPVGDYYGGVVAAPVFQEIASRALRILGVPPPELQAVVGAKHV